jgi:hypothetical protein
MCVSILVIYISYMQMQPTGQFIAECSWIIKLSPIVLLWQSYDQIAVYNHLVDSMIFTSQISTKAIYLGLLNDDTHHQSQLKLKKTVLSV